MKTQGNIAIHTENIFPIIKKFLYSDQEVFLRELVANAVDATQKLHQLAAMGKYEEALGKGEIHITLDEKKKTITISDQGIGMTSDEVKKYINQIAFSGAAEFVEKYEKDHLIGSFGLGFYAAFMVASKVEIFTRSYQKEAEPMHWQCAGDTKFSLEKTIKKTVGTDVVLHISDEAKEYLNKQKIQSILKKYGRFLPFPILFEGKQINDTAPLWTKTPSTLTDKDYKDFYSQLYPYQWKEPLFWIHLNVDYPFKLTGVLYFAQPNEKGNFKDGKIQLYAKQVFITDELAQIVPDFLKLMHGAIDSPDIPLNVSRSALQSDGNVKKINTYITKKVAEKLIYLFKNERKAYEEKWDSMSLVIKYGCLTDDNFYDKIQPALLYKNTEGEYFTHEAYVEKIKDHQTDKDQNSVIIYTTDPITQDIHIQQCQQKKYDVIVVDSVIDPPYIQLIENKQTKVKFRHVNTETADQIIEKDCKELSVSLLKTVEEKKIKEMISNVIDNKLYSYKVEARKNTNFPLMMYLTEETQRLQKVNINASTNEDSIAALPYTVIINTSHPVYPAILSEKDPAQQKKYLQHLYDLALLTQNALEGNHLTAFIQRSIQWMEKK